MKKIWVIIRIILLLAIIGLFIWFAIPMSIQIIDIGNILGCFICLLGLIVVAFFDKVKSLCKKICKNRFGKWALRITSLIVILGFAYVAVVSCLIVAFANKSPDPGSTVIVLGCKVNGTEPSLMLLKRLQVALGYLNENKEAVCIVSGGKGDNEDISEAQCMYNYLTDHGISEKRIILEDKSTTTKENLEFSKKIIEERGLRQNIAIATDGFHEFRAYLIAKKVGLNPTGAISADTPLYLLATYHFRETIAIANELVFG